MSKLITELLKAGKVLDAQEVPTKNRIMRYMTENGAFYEVELPTERIDHVKANSTGKKKN